VLTTAVIVLFASDNDITSAGRYQAGDRKILSPPSPMSCRRVLRRDERGGVPPRVEVGQEGQGNALARDGTQH
jgi:hypothetical protein